MSRSKLWAYGARGAALVALGGALAGCRAEAKPAAELAIVATDEGAALDAIEANLALPIERVLGRLEFPAGLRTFVTDGRVEVRVRFDDAEAARQAAPAVFAALEELRRFLPDTAAAPSVTLRVAQPRTWLILSGEAFAPGELGQLAERLADRLRALDGLTEVRVCGEGRPELQVVLDPGRLAAFGLDPGAVVAAFARGDDPRPRGELGRDGPPPPDASALERIVLANAAGRVVTVADVARVSSGPARPECRAYRAGAAPVAVVALRGALPEALPTGFLPEGVRLTQLREATQTVLVAPDGLPPEGLARVARDLAAHSDPAHALVLTDELPLWDTGSWPPAADGPSLRVVADDAAFATLPPPPGFAAGAVPDERTEERWTIDAQRAERVGVRPEAVPAALALCFDGRIAGFVEDSRAARSVPIRVRWPDCGALSSITVAGADGQRVPLSELVERATVRRPLALWRLDGQRIPPRAAPTP